MLPRQSLITIYKYFNRSHLDYGDIIYDQPNNESFCNLVERVQYNAASAITGVIKGTSQLKIYNELGIESLKFRRWFRWLCVFYKIKTNLFPKYLYELIPTESHTYNTRNIENVNTYYYRTELFKYSFFPYVIVKWNKLDINLRNAKSFLIFRNSLLKIGRLIICILLIINLDLTSKIVWIHYVLIGLKLSQLFIISCIVNIIMIFVRLSLLFCFVILFVKMFTSF